jgi:hypothetical protein
MNKYLLIAIFPLLSVSQTYKVKDKNGNDTGIRLEKEKSSYEQGFEAGYGKPVNENTGTTVIINNYSSNSNKSYSPSYVGSYSTGYTRGEKKRAKRWVKRRLKKRAKKKRRRRN